jgi:plasmid stabilization system protein ParE
VKPYVLALEAEDDLNEIWRYLFEEAGLDVADRIQNEVVEAFELLSDFPGSGHRRGDLTSYDVLFIAVYQYLIVYRLAATLEIVAVLHGKRNLRRLLKTRLR